jgi:hypothetical protein
VHCIFAFELAWAALPVGQLDVTHPYVRAWRICCALELGHGGRDAWDNAPLAGAATHSLERNVREQGGCRAVDLLTWERTVMPKKLQRPVHILEHHILVADTTDGACGVGARFDATAASSRLVLRAACLPTGGRDVRERLQRHHMHARARRLSVNLHGTQKPQHLLRTTDQERPNFIT